MPLTTALRLAKRHPARLGVVTGLVAAPYLVLAAAGELVAESVPVAFLLGLTLVAVAAYFDSARAPVPAGRPATRGGCKDAVAASAPS